MKAFEIPEDESAKLRLSTDNDVTTLLTDISKCLQKSRLAYSEEEADQLVRQYYFLFRDPEFCASIGIPVQDDDFFFHQGADDMALRIYYYLVLKADPDPAGYVEWRAALQKRLHDPFPGPVK